MALYYPVGNYYSETRALLQDLVGPPYRYIDEQIIAALNIAMGEIGRIRPDLFLNLKYQLPLPQLGPYNDGLPGPFSVDSSGNAILTPIVPLPQTYFMPVCWYISGLIQFYDVDDTQDVRAQSFHQKFIGSMMAAAA